MKAKTPHPEPGGLWLTLDQVLAIADALGYRVTVIDGLPWILDRTGSGMMFKATRSDGHRVGAWTQPRARLARHDEMRLALGLERLNVPATTGDLFAGTYGTVGETTNPAIDNDVPAS